jgi:hypothetical protein
MAEYILGKMAANFIFSVSPLQKSFAYFFACTTNSLYPSYSLQKTVLDFRFSQQ